MNQNELKIYNSAKERFPNWTEEQLRLRIFLDAQYFLGADCEKIIESLTTSVVRTKTKDILAKMIIYGTDSCAKIALQALAMALGLSTSGGFNYQLWKTGRKYKNNAWDVYCKTGSIMKAIKTLE